jgi:hypothetical protein
MVNAPSEVLPAIPDALRLVGAHQTADLVEQARKIILKAARPRNQAEHDAALDAVEESDVEALEPLDRRFFESGEPLSSLLLAYLKGAS